MSQLSGLSPALLQLILQQRAAQPQIQGGMGAFANDPALPNQAVEPHMPGTLGPNANIPDNVGGGFNGMGNQAPVQGQTSGGPLGAGNIQGQVGGQNVYGGAPNQLNDQGYGAVGVPGLSSPPPPMRGQQAGLGRNWLPQGGPAPQQQYRVQANPLTGVLENVPLPTPIGPRDPRRLWQVQQLEQALDQVQQSEEFNPQQKAFAQNKIQNRLQSIDPMRQYRKDSLAQQMTPMENFVAQQMHIDKEHGFAVALDSKGVPHFHKLEDNRLEMQKEFESHKMEMQQKLLDQKHAHEQHIMEMQQTVAQAKADQQKAALDHQAKVLELHQKVAEMGHTDRQAKLDEHSAFWKEYNTEVGNAYKRLTKKGTKPGEADTPPTKEEVAAHLDEFFPHMRKRRWELEGTQPGQAAVPPPAANGVAPTPKNDLLMGLRQGFGE